MDKKVLLLGLVALTGLMMYMGSGGEGAEGKEGLRREFAAFQGNFGKEYSSVSEMEYRRMVFEERVEAIARHNADPTQTYTLGINQFSDLTFEEFAAYYLAEDPEDDFQEGQDRVGLFRGSRLDRADETQVDWREKNIVHAVKNQGSCGSCWAFSAVSVVEEAYALFKGVPIPTLAEQELVDCSGSYGNDGCGGGFSFQGLDYIRDKGINLETAYPYTARDGKCKDIAGKGEYKIQGWEKQPPGPDSMIAALRKQPTTASFHVQGDFMSYKSGVYNPKSCPGNRNHAVNAIGFNLESETPYFLVKNSWGARWGEQGFFKIAIKEGNGTCWFNGEGRTTIPVLE